MCNFTLNWYNDDFRLKALFIWLFQNSETILPMPIWYNNPDQNTRPALKMS
jgi:hypothetical protein